MKLDPHLLAEVSTKDDLEFLLGTVAGKRFLFRLIQSLAPMSTVFTASAVTYYEQGKRDVGTNLLEAVAQVNPWLWGEYRAWLKAVTEPKEENDECTG